MRRNLPITLLAALPVFYLALGAEIRCTQSTQARPSVAGLQEQIEFDEDANCAVADANRFEYRPVYCAPRCDCLQAIDLSGADSCEEVAPGRFVVTARRSGTCESFGCTYGIRCGDLPCQEPLTCFNDILCVSNPDCTSNADCPDVESTIVELSGVGEPDSLGVAQCKVTSNFDGLVDLNSNDALECLAQIEELTGPCR